MKGSARRRACVAFAAAAASAVGLAGGAAATSSATSADLSISITAPAQIVDASSFQYVITVRNLGAGDSSSATVDDDMPFPNTHEATATSTSGTCAVTDASNGSVTFHDHVHCDLGPLANGATAEVTITEFGSNVGPVTNTAKVGGAEADPDSTNNSASATTVFKPADASVAVVAPASATDGTPFASTVTVTNAGPAAVPRTDLDVSWSGADFVSASSATGSCTPLNGLLECFFDGLAAGQSGSVTITLVSAGTGTARVNGSILDLQNAYDTSSGNNQASGSTAVGPSSTTPQADIGLTLTGPAALKNGQGGAWSMTVTNHSATTTATGVHIGLSGIQHLAVDLVASGACVGGSNTDCALDALGPGASVTLTFGGNATAEGTAALTATATSTSADPDLTNNSSTVTTAVAPGADLAAELTAPAQVVSGAFTYAIAVHSLGPAGSAGATVDDELPAFVGSHVTATSPDGTCAILQEPGAGGFVYPHVRCTLGPLVVGATATVTIGVDHGAIGPITDTVTVRGADGDVNHRNDSASATTVFAPTDVGSSWSVPSNAVAGQSFDDVLTVVNGGPTGVDRLDVTVLTSGQTLVSSSSPCTAISPGNLSCHLDGLAAGDTAALTFTFVQSSTGTATVQAFASPQNAYDTNPANDDPSASTRVTGPGADFGVSISGPANAQQNVAFTFGVTLSANGPETSNGGIRGTLPAGLQYVSASSSDCLADGPNGFDCFVTSMAAATHKTYTITVRPTSAGAMTVDLRTALGALVDPNAANDTASLSLEVLAPPPTITCPADVVQATEPGRATADVDPGTATAAGGTAPVQVAGVRSDGAPLSAPYPFGSTAITWTATDADERTATCVEHVVVVDREAPSTTATPSASGWANGPVTVDFTAGDNVGVDSIHVDDKVYAGSSAGVTVSQEGVTTLTYWAVDSSGNAETQRTITVRIDETAPDLSCAGADGAWHAANVALACSATDGGSGLASASDASFVLSTSVAEGEEAANATTNAQRVCDVAGNCVTAGPLGGNRVDRKAPAITIESPAPDAAYVIGSVATAAFDCADGGSGVATCDGSAQLDTATPGEKELVVHATDATGNASSAARAYVVGYGVCAIAVDPPVAGPMVHVSLRLCDAAGHTLSAPGVSVTAVAMDGARIPADSSFRLAGGTYRLELRLPASLPAGTHALQVSVAGDPTPHTIHIRTR